MDQNAGSDLPAGVEENEESSSTSSDEDKDPVASLKCSVCKKVCYPPIHNCIMGHLTCKTCLKAIKSCPVCDCPTVGMRNYSMESLAIQHFRLSEKCPYVSDGCFLRMPEVKLESHKEICQYRPLECTFERCEGRGIPFGEYLNHLRIDHHIRLVPQANDVTERKTFIPDMSNFMEDGSRAPVAMECHGHKFLKLMHAKDGIIWVWIAICGIESDAHRFTVSLTAFNVRSNDQASWRGEVHAVRKSPKEVFDSGSCLVLTGPVIKKLVVHTFNGPALNMKIQVMYRTRRVETIRPLETIPDTEPVSMPSKKYYENNPFHM